MATKNIKNYIKLEDCKDGYLYIISARNAHIGIFDAKKFWFIISRHKFTTNFIDYEDHWDLGPPHGTVKPLKELHLAKDTTIEYLNIESDKYYEEYKKLMHEKLNISIYNL
ncbi:MAG: hypothetical protein M0R17_02700 [Candidatus Omnitrophica bacterium]|jgi:hypothetical protein|nr:hypothetical protein [Candidatus Omnitrophota bacterium]